MPVRKISRFVWTGMRQWIRLTIRDHGAGVPLAIAEQIGRPFITTKGKGFGLGLFLSQPASPALAAR